MMKTGICAAALFGACVAGAASAQKGKDLSYGSAGNGTISHLSDALFNP